MSSAMPQKSPRGRGVAFKCCYLFSLLCSTTTGFVSASTFWEKLYCSLIYHHGITWWITEIFHYFVVSSGTGLTQDVFIVLHDRWDILCSGQENGISGHSSQMHSWACCHFTRVAQWIVNICACFLGLYHLSVLTFWRTFSSSHSGICVIIWSCALLFLLPKNLQHAKMVNIREPTIEDDLGYGWCLICIGMQRGRSHSKCFLLWLFLWNYGKQHVCLWSGWKSFFWAWMMDWCDWWVHYFLCCVLVPWKNHVCGSRLRCNSAIDFSDGSKIRWNIGG